MGLGISRGLCLPARRDIRHVSPQLSPLAPLVSTPSSRMQPGRSWASSNTAPQHSSRKVSRPSIVVDSTLAQLPFFYESEEIDGRSSVPTPSSVCQQCWDCLFAGHFGLPCQAPPGWAGPLYRRWPKSVSYTTSSPELRSRALAGCVWCQLVAAQTKPIDNLAEPDGSLHITVRGLVQKDTNGKSPNNFQMVEASINNRTVLIAYVHTTPGKLAQSGFLGWNRC